MAGAWAAGDAANAVGAEGSPEGTAGRRAVVGETAQPARPATAKAAASAPRKQIEGWERAPVVMRRSLPLVPARLSV
jgi:hypothetical protein